MGSYEASHEYFFKGGYMKLNFYDIDSKYTDYLRNYDEKIPYINYDSRDKFLCGVVLSINSMNYYVPVSSNKNKFLSS